MENIKDLQEVSDGLENVISGLGTAKARGNSSKLGGRDRLDRIELEDIYRNYWISKAIDIRPWDMTREWRKWKAESIDELKIRQLEKYEKKLKLSKTVRQALTYGSIYGGGAIVMHVQNSGEIGTPLNINAIGKGDLVKLTAVDRWELVNLGTVDFNPMSPMFGRSEQYYVAYDEARIPIHHSRIVFFNGREMPIRIARQLLGWGDSDIQRWYDAVINSETLGSAIIEAVHQANIDVIATKDLAQTLSMEGGDDLVKNRFLLMDMCKSLLNMAVIDAEDTFTRNAFPFSGLPDLWEMAIGLLAAAVDIPKTRLLGASPGGLNATGESDVRFYYDSIKSEQENKLAPKLDELDQVLIRSVFGEFPEDLEYEFNSLYQATDAERETIKGQQADTLLKLRQLGVPDDVLMRDAVEMGLSKNLTMEQIDEIEATAELDLGIGEDDEDTPPES